MLTKPRRFLSGTIQSQLSVKGTTCKSEKAFKGMSKGMTPHLMVSDQLTYYGTDFTKWKRLTILILHKRKLLLLHTIEKRR